MNKFANLNRRRHTPSEKLEIVLEALKKEQSVAQLALQFEINANQLTRWIKEYREGASWAHKAQQVFLPVSIKPDKKVNVITPETQPATTKRNLPPACATILFNNGHRLELSKPTPVIIKSLVEALR